MKNKQAYIDLIESFTHSLNVLLNTSVKELEKQAAEKVKEKEIEEYQASLPLTMIKLMSEAEKEGIPYKVEESNYLPRVYIIIFKDTTNEGNDQYLFTNSKNISDVVDIEDLIEKAKQRRLKSKHRYNILKSAQEKLKQTLTEEELEILKENGI